MLTRFLQGVTGSGLARRIADVGLARYAQSRVGQLDSMDTAEVQEKTLLRLVHRARKTRFGVDHRFSEIGSIADYQASVPLRDYEQFWSQYWEASFPNLAGVTWPDAAPYYALSSGTTSGATKYIPVTAEMLSSNKKAALTTVALFRKYRPKADIFTGKIFFLGGSTDLRKQADGSLAGDLSGIASREVWSGMRPYTFPPPELALISDWELKVSRLAELSVHERITVISGIPAWLLVLFERVKQFSGKDRIAEVWPELKLIIHGGTNFSPYANLFQKEFAGADVTFQDTYPCSEGYVATEDPRHGMLRLIPDHDIFFEFVPVDELGTERPTRHTVRTVEVGQQYAVVMTSCAGVWSYVVGDTVSFESVNPPLLRFTGRTKYFLSAFGEHLIAEEVEKAVSEAARQVDRDVIDFHVGPVFPEDPKNPGFHRYFIEFADATADAGEFARLIDESLCKLNEDYEAHRIGDLSMLKPEVISVRAGGFADWMRSRGKYGGQNKVPRMDNTGEITGQLKEFFKDS